VIQEVGDDERLNLPLLVRESRERREKLCVLLIRKSENTNKVLTLLVKSRRAYIA
jgi:hypothetical protein